jgi:hypothetical protein
MSPFGAQNPEVASRLVNVVDPKLLNKGSAPWSWAVVRCINRIPEKI